MVELAAGATVARIDPAAGGRLASLVVGGVERILPQSVGARQTSWGCFPMVPWPGRLAEGRIPTADGEVRLEPNHGSSAIHGLGFDAAWTILERSDTAVRLSCELRGRGWPFGGVARQSVRLGPASLDLELEVGEYTRAGPAGLGWHPWFTRPRAGDLEVTLDAQRVLVLDADMIPTGEVRTVTGAEDLRAGPPLGDRRLDHVYVDPTGPAFVRWPDLELRIDFDRPLNTVVVHTPEKGVCVEPQTMWPNAPILASNGLSGTGLRTLAPGDRLRATHRWTWSLRDERTRRPAIASPREDGNE